LNTRCEQLSFLIFCVGIFSPNSLNFQIQPFENWNIAVSFSKNWLFCWIQCVLCASFCKCNYITHYIVSGGALNSTHSLTHSLTHYK